jgi:hypothetical protein
VAYWSGQRWHDVTAADINGYLAEITGGEFTAKDFASHGGRRPGQIAPRGLYPQPWEAAGEHNPTATQTGMKHAKRFRRPGERP